VSSAGADVRYIRFVPNVPNFVSASQRRFIDDVSRLLVPWGVPATAARIYGRLLLSAAPVPLEQLASELEMSKSSVSVAARTLEMYRMARRSGVRGSRRVLYEVSASYEGMLGEQIRMLGALAALLETGARAAGSRAARERMKDMAELYVVLGEAMDSAIRRWERRKKS
jgi:DNA-binding transcriptional regulator GbsR (MarR family)